MQAAIVSIEPVTGTTVVTVAVIAMIAAHIDTKPACARCRGCADADDRQGGQHVRELSHCSSPLVVARGKTNAAVVCCREQWETFLNARSPSLHQCSR